MGKIKGVLRMVLPARTQAVVGPHFATHRADAHRLYLRVVGATKGIHRWDASDSAFMDLLDRRIVMLHRQAGAQVPEEQTERPAAVDAGADRLLVQLQDEIVAADEPRPTRPVLPPREVPADAEKSAVG